MPFPAGPADLLGALARVFTTLGLDWYVFGAQAALIWGRPRLTADVDVTVRLASDDTAGFVEALQRRGFRLRVAGTPEFVRRTRVLPFSHDASGIAVDVVLAGPGLEELFQSRAVMLDIGGEPVPVISPEDLIVTKILAGRPKDIEDIRGVLVERGDRLDFALVRSTLRTLEDALGQSDLVPVLEAEVARWRHSMR
ncbi:MAG: nucleotidyltransferase [Acidobacteriota bacterium]